MLKTGRHSFADHELLELLLTYSLPRIDTKPLAKALLHKYGSIGNVLQQPDQYLMNMAGIGPKTSTFFKVIHACMTRCAEIDVEQQRSISGPEDLFAYIRMHLGPRTNECIYALYLNDSKCVIHHSEIGAGTVDRTPFYPREILKPALMHNATGIILAHNHPEGLPVPSENDLEMTRKLEIIAAPLGIKLLDHLIITRKNVYSIKTGKLL
jgi:DNA repair protein RadC